MRLNTLYTQILNEGTGCPVLKVTKQIQSEVIRFKSDEDLLRGGGISIEALDRAAHGFSEGDIKTIHPSKLSIKWKEDHENVMWEIKKSGMNITQWSKQINLNEPIDVSFKNGKFFIEDGHHRYVAAKTLNVELNCNLEIKENPIRVLAPTLGYDEFHRCLYKQVSSGVSEIVEGSKIKTNRGYLIDNGDKYTKLTTDKIEYENALRLINNPNKHFVKYYSAKPHNEKYYELVMDKLNPLSDNDSDIVDMIQQSLGLQEYMLDSAKRNSIINEFKRNPEWYEGLGSIQDVLKIINSIYQMYLYAKNNTFSLFDLRAQNLGRTNEGILVHFDLGSG